MGVGFWGVGRYLPDPVRSNEWWPSDVVAGWAPQLALLPRTRRLTSAQLTPSARAVARGFDAVDGDPFVGSIRRHVLEPDRPASDMEALASAEALRSAGVAPGDIDAALVYAQVPDYLCVNHGAILQTKLALRPDCLVLTADAVCSSLLVQLQLAEGLIASGRARRVLLVQSSATTRLMDPARLASPWFGDGATAAVVGPVSDGRGLLATSNYTDGTLSGAFVATVHGGRWYEAGAVTGHTVDRAASEHVMLSTPDVARAVTDRALDRANLRAKAVQFHASHQPISFVRAVTQEFSGLAHAGHGDVYADTASLGPSNILAQLYDGTQRDALRPGDVAVLVSFAAGLTAAAVVLRWGR